MGLSVNKVKALGLENLPEGGFLLLPNNLTGRDVVVPGERREPLYQDHGGSHGLEG